MPGDGVTSMECDKIRDRFSSLLENESDPSEEKAVREHLASCSDCQKDLQQFEKTIRWLHSVKDVEVPDGFLSEINKKMEERKRKVHFLSISLKLPVQAVAMVTIVFLVLYLTKTMPLEKLQLKGAEHTRPFISGPLSEEKKTDQLPAKREVEKERVAAKPSLKEIEKSKIPASEAIPAPSEKEKREAASIVKEKTSSAAKPPREIVLRTFDREKALNQIQILLQQFEGKMITTGGDVFLASLPAATFSEFEKELLGLSSSGRKDKIVQEKDMAENYTVPAGAKRIDGEGKAKMPSKFAAEQEDHIVVRVLLLQE